MRRFLITNLYNMFNMGEVLHLRALTGHFKDDEFTLNASYSFVDYRLCDELGVKVVGACTPSRVKYAVNLAKVLLQAVFWRLTGKLPSGRLVRAYRSCDAVIDLGGDTFSDSPSLIYTLVHIASLLPAVIMKRPYIICSQSIGPFKTPVTRALASSVLKRALLIMVRDPISSEYLESGLHIEKGKVCLVPDLGFSVRRSVKLSPHGVIGVCPSQILPFYMGWDYGGYVKALARLIEHLMAYGGVVLIPHVLGPHRGVGKVANVDDRTIIREIQKLINVPERPHTIIPECKLVVGFRWHACVSAVTHNVPTVYVGQGRKSSGLPKGEGVRVVDLSGVAVEDMPSAVVTAAVGVLGKKVDGGKTAKESVSAFGLIDRYYRGYSERFIGPYIRCFVGAAKNNVWRDRAASGGVVTCLVLQSTLDGKVPLLLKDGAFESCINGREVLESAGSVYASDRPLSKLVLGLRKPHDLVVGLPCQVRYLRRREPDTMAIGLFCSHRIEEAGVRHFREHFHLQNGGVVYRTKHGGDTGMMVDGHFIPMKQYWSHLMNFVYIPKMCLKCGDMCAEGADISLGDAWGYKEAYGKGLNAIVVRTERGQELLDRAVESGLLWVDEVSPRDVMGTQPEFLPIKKGCPSLKGGVYLLLRKASNRLPKTLIDLWMSLAVHPKRIGGG
jgi:colanic acid/amylovoran biosynthesis protein